MFKYAFLFLSASVLLSCSQSNQSQQLDKSIQSYDIIGGKAAFSADEVTKSTVALMINYSGQPFAYCTGTLVSEDLILTAAHCMNEDMYVFMGSVLPKTLDNVEVFKVEKYSGHPDFGRARESDENGVVTSGSDIAVIKIVGKAPSWAIPRMVLDEHQAVDSGDRLLLSGYGVVNEVSNPIQDAIGLNQVYVQVAKTFGNIIVTDQTNAQGACMGDSGGPAYLETSKGLVVVGATRGPHAGAPDCRHFGEYTAVKGYKSFILEKAQEWGAQLPTFTTRY